MWSFSTLSIVAWLGGFHALHVNAIQTISAVGSKFFYEDGTQYFLKGIAYQLIPEDPLVDTAQCKRDVARMAELGTNAIRVYHVDPKANHDGCMEALAAAGIYLFVDLDTFDTSIRQDKPEWTHAQFDRYKAVLDEFQKYNNTAGVFVGNEVINTREGSAAAPHVLAAACDIKSYRNEKGYRNIPVGYSAADIAELRPMLQNYLACRPDPADRLDFFSLNAYEWCGRSSYETSGYKTLQSHVSEYPIPIFFSETGCNVARPRTFEDQAAIFGPEMSNTWSGSIVYEWIQEANDYGLINYGPLPGAPPAKNPVQDGFTRQGEPIPVAPDFHNLKAQWVSLRPTGVVLSDYVKSTSTIKPASCPASTPGGWAVDPNQPLPTLVQNFHRAPPDATAFRSNSGSGSGLDSASKPDSGSDPSYRSARVTSVAPTGYHVYSAVNGVSSTSSGMSNFDSLTGVSLFLCMCSISALALWL
ncbi:putative 1,3-beta-glucanosyltransferase [Aspergillus alliaceus]|uniref:putative 1,3-beta-glucanosyltransferase n=1 Tax=Petromyces alliaceus TaxID=209559 RepID=UPI0012A487E5|nr:Glucanosyltransferase-domain-containing protein [Aspergillus alliaceus]KAB8230480.1 Glucanosyltransferase-domain-containing protein [Aspergillus alliaceus]